MCGKKQSNTKKKYSFNDSSKDHIGTVYVQYIIFVVDNVCVCI